MRGSKLNIPPESEGLFWIYKICRGTILEKVLGSLQTSFFRTGISEVLQNDKDLFKKFRTEKSSEKIPLLETRKRFSIHFMNNKLESKQAKAQSLSAVNFVLFGFVN